MNQPQHQTVNDAFEETTPVEDQTVVEAEQPALRVIEGATGEAVVPEAAGEVDAAVETGAGGENETPGIDLIHAKRVLEAALFSASEPIPLADLRRLFDRQLSVDVIRTLLEDLRGEWSERAIELTPVASGWRFRVRPEFARHIAKMNPEKAPRYSRAVMETLAIIAYRQPATRGDVEQIRGVAVSAQIIKTLEERGWIEAIGHKEVPGRPTLFGTTKQFLDDLNLRDLMELPPLEELQGQLEMTTIAQAPEARDAEAAIEVATPIVDVEPEESVAIVDAQAPLSEPITMDTATPDAGTGIDAVSDPQTDASAEVGEPDDRVPDQTSL